jgi:hypothetical protein
MQRKSREFKQKPFDYQKLHQCVHIDIKQESADTPLSLNCIQRWVERHPDKHRSKLRLDAQQEQMKAILSYLLFAGSCDKELRLLKAILGYIEPDPELRLYNIKLTAREYCNDGLTFAHIAAMNLDSGDVIIDLLQSYGFSLKSLTKKTVSKEGGTKVYNYSSVRAAVEAKNIKVLKKLHDLGHNIFIFDKEQSILTKDFCGFFKNDASYLPVLNLISRLEQEAFPSQPRQSQLTASIDVAGQLNYELQKNECDHKAIKKIKTDNPDYEFQVALSAIEHTADVRLFARLTNLKLIIEFYKYEPDYKELLIKLAKIGNFTSLAFLLSQPRAKEGLSNLKNELLVSVLMQAYGNEHDSRAKKTISIVLKRLFEKIKVESLEWVLNCENSDGLRAIHYAIIHSVEDDIFNTLVTMKGIDLNAAYSDQSGQAFQSVSGQRFRSYPAINSNLSGQHH